MIYSFWKQFRVWILLIALITSIAYIPSLTIPSIFGDEWGNIGSYLSGELTCLNLDSPRLLGDCLLLLLNQVFGLNIIGYKLLAITGIFIQGILLLFLLDQFLPKKPFFNFAVVALYLIFPSIWIRTWMFGYFSIHPNLLLLSFILLTLFMHKGSYWYFLSGLFLLVITLFMYENIIGVTILFSIILFLKGKNSHSFRKYVILAPALFSIFFSLWRLNNQMNIGTAFGHSAEDINTDVFELGSRFISAYRVNLQRGWAGALLNVFPWLRTGGNHELALASLVFFGGLIVLSALMAFIFRLRQKENPRSQIDRSRIIEIVSAYGWPGLAGLAFIIAGYIPVILIDKPDLGFEASRHNYLPAFGAALFLVAGLTILLVLLDIQKKHIGLALLCTSLPLIILGAAQQIIVQQETFQGWREQKNIWHQLFAQAPDFTTGTAVYLLLPSYPERTGARPFASGPWAFGKALTLMYGKPINGFFAYPEYPQRFTPNGVFHPAAVEPIPYSKIVLFSYDKESGQLKRLTSFPGVESSLSSEIKLCSDCVLDHPPVERTYRDLVK